MAEDDPYYIGNYFHPKGWKIIGEARQKMYGEQRERELKKLDEEQGTRYQEVLSKIDPDAQTNVHDWVDHSEEIWKVEDVAIAFAGSGFVNPDGTSFTPEQREKMFQTRVVRTFERVGELREEGTLDVKHLVKEKLHSEQESTIDILEEAFENPISDVERETNASYLKELEGILDAGFENEFDEEIYRRDVVLEIERLKKVSKQILDDDQKKEAEKQLEILRIDTLVLDHSLNKKDRLERRDERIKELQKELEDGRKKQVEAADNDEERAKIRKNNEQIEEDIKAVEKSKKRLEDIPSLDLGALSNEQRKLVEDYHSKSVHLNVLISEILAVNETDNERMDEMFAVLGELRAELSELNEQIKIFVWERPGGKYYKMVNIQDVSGKAGGDVEPDAVALLPNFNLLFWGDGNMNWHAVDSTGSVLDLPDNKTATMRLDVPLKDQADFDKLLDSILAAKSNSDIGLYEPISVDLPEVSSVDLENQPAEMQPENAGQILDLSFKNDKELFGNDVELNTVS